MEAIGQLTGGVAHDFNNLLTVIRGSVDLLRRSDLSEAKRARYTDAIGSTADRAIKLTSQLLAFSRRQALTPEQFDVGESLREVANIVSTLIGSRVELRLELPEEPVFANADRGQFDTAIVNMAINARDAMDGEGVLGIELGPVCAIPAIRRHAPTQGEFIAVSIRDTGSGIAPEDVDRIFEPFFTTKEVGAGTGLGLSQVIGFAKQSGGDVHVTSQPGQGTCFTLYLPRAEPPPIRLAAKEGPVSATVGEGLCVLVVEDNEQVGAFATQALRELGYESVLARNADQALAELATARERFHIVFSDVVMPGMSGIDLANRIRRDHPDLPVVLASGYSHVLAEHGTHGVELLRKPYSVEQLSRVLRKAVRGSATAS
jgi:CheY-like chemotaxis protein